MDFAVRLNYTLPLLSDLVTNPAEERTLRRDLEGEQEYGARTMTALLAMRPREGAPGPAFLKAALPF